jgi:hypothetical protein
MIEPGLMTSSILGSNFLNDYGALLDFKLEKFVTAKEREMSTPFMMKF